MISTANCLNPFSIFKNLLYYQKLGLRLLCSKLSSEEPNDHIQDLLQYYERCSDDFIPDSFENVILVQPTRNHGILRIKDATQSQSLFEAKALINTLKSWKINNEIVVKLRHLDNANFFTQGHYDLITEQILEDTTSTAVFINWSYLTALQINNLQVKWNKTVYDRYMMVLKIFKMHSTTYESKLQVQLAELPYFRSRLFGYHRRNSHSETVESFQSIITQDNSSLVDKYNALKLREHNILRKLKELESRRDLQRQTRKNICIPTASVIGYTNSGKTSLIRLLSHDSKLIPRNDYFATLDVTYHDCYLGFHSSTSGFNGMKSIFVDTIGFMSEIPTVLIGAFKSTLRETTDTNLLIHVVDVSNEFWQNQLNFTLKTIHSLQLPKYLMDSIITVGTKIDLISQEQLNEISAIYPEMILISNLTNKNINEQFKPAVIQKLIQNCQLVPKKVKVKIASKLHSWILSNAIVANETIFSADSNYSLMDIYLTKDKDQLFINTFRHIH